MIPSRTSQITKLAYKESFVPVKYTILILKSASPGFNALPAFISYSEGESKKLVGLPDSTEIPKETTQCKFQAPAQPTTVFPTTAGYAVSPWAQRI